MTKQTIAAKTTDSWLNTKPTDPESSMGSGRNDADTYRYERVTMGLLMDDMRFRRDAVRAGDAFPQFELSTTDGRQIRKDDFVGKRPLLVVFGSISCPLTVSSIEPLKQLYRKFGHEIEFVTVNVREAHPGENTGQPIDDDQKLRHARELQTRYEIPWVVAVDDLGGTLHRALDTKPNAAYLMAKDGSIAFRALSAGDDLAVEQALLSVSQGRQPSKKESQSMLKPMAHAIGFIDNILKEAGPQAQIDMLRVAPPLMLAAKIANLFFFLAKPQRGAVALTIIGIVAAAVAVGAIGVFI